MLAVRDVSAAREAYNAADLVSIAANTWEKSSKFHDRAFRFSHVLCTYFYVHIHIRTEADCGMLCQLQEEQLTRTGQTMLLSADVT